MTQTQTDENQVNTVESGTPIDDNDGYLHFDESEFVHQTPMHPECLTSVPHAPVIRSPERAKISGKDVLAKSSAKSQKKTASARSQMEKRQKHQKKVVHNSAVINIFQFVTKNAFDSIASESTSIPMNWFDIIVQSANSH